MSFIRSAQLCFLAISAIVLSIAGPVNSTQAQVINLDFSGIVVDEDEVNGLSLVNALRYVEAVEQGKEFWDERVLGYSNTLPQQVQSELSGGLTIFVSNAALGPNILGQAGVDQMTLINVLRGTDFRNQPFAISQAATLTLSNDFILNNTTEEIVDVAIHEFGHALGVGSLWFQNGLLEQVAGIGPFQYIGPEARRAFAIDAGVAGLAQTGFIPIEQQGGGGTALAHWEDDNDTFNSVAVDNRIELMTGFLIPNTERFISRTTLASLVDMHYVVRGFNEDELIEFPRIGRNLPALGLNRNLVVAAAAGGAGEAVLRKNAAVKNRQQQLRLYKKRRK